MPHPSLPRHSLALALLLVTGLGCGDDDPVDHEPPAPVTTLSAAKVDSVQVRLTWIAPADQGGERVERYDVRYQEQPLDAAGFLAAPSAPNPPIPAEPGLPETLVIGSLRPGTDYWFALTSRDVSGNVSELSNVATTRTGYRPPTNANWSAFSGDRAIDGYVYELMPDGDGLIVGGHFTRVGALSTLGVALWDGTAWSAYAQGAEGPVRGLARFNGRIVAAGEFGGLESVTLNITEWSNGLWTTLGAGLNDAVRALVVHQGLLVAAGVFTASADIPMSRVAAWDGTTWRPLGDGLPSRPDALESFDGMLYAGGAFGLWRWDGASWADMDVVGEVKVLREVEGSLVVGGLFNQAGGIPANQIARWDGGAWSPLGDGFNNAVTALGYYHGQLVAGGVFTLSGSRPVSRIARWDGLTWQPFASGVDKLVEDIEVLGEEMYVGGTFINAGGTRSKGIAIWRD